MDLQQTYADAMRHHPFGFALYQPCDKTVLKPGSCGYFDIRGDWNPITHILTSQDPFVQIEEELQMADPQILEWGPKCSSHVTEHRLVVAGTAYPHPRLQTDARSMPGMPADVNLCCRYKSSLEYGAVLLTVPPVTKEFYYHDMPFLKWFERNAQAILKNFPDVKERDLWVVTMTCSTPECSLNAWRSTDKEVTVGFSAAVSALAGLEAKGKWYTASEDGGWNYFRQKGKQYVVFVGGLRFRYSKRIAAVNSVVSDSRQKAPFKPIRIHRGADHIEPPMVEVEHDGETYEISCERWSALEESAENEW